jgi:hypothetical protein
MLLSDCFSTIALNFWNLEKVSDFLSRKYTPLLKNSTMTKKWRGFVIQLLYNIDEKIKKNRQATISIKKYKIKSFFKSF